MEVGTVGPLGQISRKNEKTNDLRGTGLLVAKLERRSMTGGSWVCVVFTLSRSFYPATSVHPVPVLILHPREIQNSVVTDPVKQSKPNIPNSSM